LELTVGFINPVQRCVCVWPPLCSLLSAVTVHDLYIGYVLLLAELTTGSLNGWQRSRQAVN